jgi:predicted ATPase
MGVNMRIALTGASSTGKTTLLNDLIQTTVFIKYGIKSILMDTRSILSKMGLRADGYGSDPARMKVFQWALLEEKVKLENLETNYITDRSTVDLAAYWLIRDVTGGLSEEDERYLGDCKAFASKYDLHIHLPFGVIPFTDDGNRPKERLFNEGICRTVHRLLNEWNLPHLSIESVDRVERVREVLSFIDKHRWGKC